MQKFSIFTLSLLICSSAYAQLSPHRGGRSVVISPHGMVCSSHALAAQVGLEILKSGGNAIDAAIATNAALALMEPMMCGPGGDLYAIVWDAKTQKLYGLNASGRSPYRATMSLFAERDLKKIPESGPLCWSVPGCVDGWDQLRQRFGTMTFEQLLAPTIRYAEEGVPVPETIAYFWQTSDVAKRALGQLPGGGPAYDDFRKTFLPGGAVPGYGGVFKNPYLAATYHQIAAGGRDAFYKGKIARQIVDFSDKVGGLFTLKDFEEHTSTWVEPVNTNYRGYDVWEIPPPGQGIAVLQMLNILEGYDLKSMGRDSADFWHLFIEAKKLAYADRARYYADPEFAKVPTSQLISKEYAVSRRKLINMKKASTDPQPGAPMGEDTTYLCVVDKDRNCVSLIQSNYHGFGSGLVPGDLGFPLQNRGANFALEANHPNRLEPHKRPFHTIIPAFVMKGGKPYYVFGVMGGDLQAQLHAQVLCNLIDFGMNAQEAGEAPRMQVPYSGAMWERPTRPLTPTLVAVEKGFSNSLLQTLSLRGHEFTFIPFSTGGYEGIVIDPATGMLHGGTEPRRDGIAAGY